MLQPSHPDRHQPRPHLRVPAGLGDVAGVAEVIVQRVQARARDACAATRNPQKLS